MTIEERFAAGEFKACECTCNVGYTIDTVDNARKVADAKGLTLVVPDSKTAIVDIDAQTVPADFKQRIGVLNRFLPVEQVYLTVTASGNLHAYIQFQEDITEEQRIIVQSTLGSDWQREMLGWGRLRTHGAPGTVAFERPDAQRIALDWEATNA